MFVGYGLLGAVFFSDSDFFEVFSKANFSKYCAWNAPVYVLMIIYTVYVQDTICLHTIYTQYICRTQCACIQYTHSIYAMPAYNIYTVYICLHTIYTQYMCRTQYTCIQYTHSIYMLCLHTIYTQYMCRTHYASNTGFEQVTGHFVRSYEW